jgi:erythromycin esterase-like protein
VKKFGRRGKQGEVVEFLEWLRSYNDAFPASAPKVGFYGLDLYSLRASMKAVLQYLGRSAGDVPVRGVSAGEKPVGPCE